MKFSAESLACYSSQRCLFVFAQGKSMRASQQMFSWRNVICVLISAVLLEIKVSWTSVVLLHNIYMTTTIMMKCSVTSGHKVCPYQWAAERINRLLAKFTGIIFVIFLKCILVALSSFKKVNVTQINSAQTDLLHLLIIPSVAPTPPKKKRETHSRDFITVKKLKLRLSFLSSLMHLKLDNLIRPFLSHPEAQLTCVSGLLEVD